MVEEARFEQTDGGLEPVTEGWFVVNVRDATWWRHDDFGAGTVFEGNNEERRRKTNAADARFQEFGINIQVVWPGQSNCMYHGEDAQEDMLVLAGECILLVEGEERRLQPWDFVHLPNWTEHVIVGTGSGPCAVLMVGTRGGERGVRYPVSELAQRHGAGVEVETDQPSEAYARFAQARRERLEDVGLPWQ
jgi:uncharacterized cupin superfamily protein